MGWLEDAASVATLGASNWGPGVINSLSGKDAADAAAEAARLQGEAGDRATAENRRQFDLTRGDLAPWMAAGRRALTEQEALMGLGGDTTGAMRTLQNSPGYRSRMLEGERALKAATFAGGGVGSGKAITAATRYNQDYASNEFTSRLNQLAALSGTGQATASNLGQYGANYAANQGNLWTGVANAQGAAGIAGATARQSGLLGMLQVGARMYGAK